MLFGDSPGVGDKYVFYVVFIALHFKFFSVFINRLFLLAVLVLFSLLSKKRGQDEILS